MFQQTDPFLQHAINHGQSMIAELNKARSLSQDMVSACDNVIVAISSGNTQNAINSIQDVRNIASQVSQSTQLFNQVINERLDMTSYALNAIQHKINEMSGAIQSLRSNTANYQMEWNPYGTQQAGQYGFNAATAVCISTRSHRAKPIRRQTVGYKCRNYWEKEKPQT